MVEQLTKKDLEKVQLEIASINLKCYQEIEGLKAKIHKLEQMVYRHDQFMPMEGDKY